MLLEAFNDDLIVGGHMSLVACGEGCGANEIPSQHVPIKEVFSAHPNNPQVRMVSFAAEASSLKKEPSSILST
ncbi:hypothetical protein JTE90_004828 [Oedothorax gibbosus]|uniref:Uncharacterized protein n=1 Tax=Oedothorax gibbosus TaxID=931172 RepID=A0AAV6URQ3_9ARAC|nr:hypothetical protein JTE90_004828 [Oedothorax gibbosus]